MKRKLISILLVFMLVFPTSAFADNSSDYNLTVIKDNAKVRIVETSDEQYIYRVTVDKSVNTAQMEITDKFTDKTKKSKTAKLGQFKNKPLMSSNNLNMELRSTSLKQNTFTNYEYTKTYGNPNQWQLRRPKSNITSYYYFDTAETSSNKEYLEDFQDAVQRVNDLEVPMVTSIGVAGLMDILSVATVAAAIVSGGTLTGAAWTAITASLSLSGIATATLISYNTACTDAYDAYFEVYKRKS